MRNVMIDLETLGHERKSVILSVGAVEFDLQAGELGRRFYKVIHAGSAQALGLTVNAMTAIWWMKQSAEARFAVCEGGLPIREVLTDFAAWLPKDPCPWGNSASFDVGMMEDAYRAAGMPVPWKWWGERCYRTVKNLYPHVPLPEATGTHHNALDDAVFQATHLIAIARSGQK